MRARNFPSHLPTVGVVRRPSARRAPRRAARYGLAALVAAIPLSGPWPVSSARAAVESFAVDHLGHFPVTDYDPWVADVWGYSDGSGRDFALLACGNSLRVLDCTDPGNIVEASVIAQPVGGNDLKDVKTWGHYAYACQEFGEILIVDLSDPYAAVQVGSIPQSDICWPSPCGFPLNGGCHNIWIDERGYLFLIGVHFDATLIYDLEADPVDPPQVGSYNPGYIHDLYVRGGIGYVANPESNGNEWELVDFRDVTDPVRLGAMTYPGVLYAHSCWPTEDGRYLLTADEGVDGHLWVFDISDPGAPFAVAEYETGSGSSIHNVQVRGSFAYIAYYDRGFRVLDISDPTNPIEVGYYRDDAWQDDTCSFSVYRGLWGIYAFSPTGNLFVSEMCGGGLHVLDFQNDDTSEAPPWGQHDRIGLSCFPNPAAAAVTLQAELERSGPVHVDIFDGSGRLVRTLARGEDRSRGAHRFAWDGRDDSGDAVAGGIYFARLAQGRRSMTEKVILLDAR